MKTLFFFFGQPMVAVFFFETSSLLQADEGSVMEGYWSTGRTTESRRSKLLPHIDRSPFSSNEA